MYLEPEVEIPGGLECRFHSKRIAEGFVKENLPLIFEALHSIRHVRWIFAAESTINLV